VADPLAQQVAVGTVAEPGQGVIEVVDRDVAQCPHAEKLRGGRAGVEPLGVLPVDQCVRRLGVDYQHGQPGRGRVERYALGCERAHVEKDRLPGRPV
jgi:hypothetical protein